MSHQPHINLLDYHQFKNLDHIYLELDGLSKQKDALEQELEKVKIDYQLKREKFAATEENKAKQDLFLENVSRELAELSAQEVELENNIKQVLNQKIDDYLSSSDFTNFVNNLVLDLQKLGEVEITLGAKTKMMFDQYDWSKKIIIDKIDDKIELKQGVKTYILDLPIVSEILYNQSLLQVLSASQ